MATCAPKNVVGGCLSWLAFALLFLALVLPWYVFTSKASNWSEECSAATVFFWATISCADSPNGCGNCDQVAVSNFWSKDDHLYEYLTPVFATNFFFIFTSTLVALFLAVFFSVRCCCLERATTPKALNIGSFVVALLSLLLLTISVLYFSIGLPKAFANTFKGAQGDGPWDTFIGTHTFDDDRTVAWAPVGWWFAVLAWPFVLGTMITLITVLSNKNREEGYVMVPTKKRIAKPRAPVLLYAALLWPVTCCMALKLIQS
ncbi:hypothetical protein QOT17_007234 [Balamuthia mandrillaris]